MRTHLSLLLCGVACLLVMAACGGGDSSGASAAASASSSGSSSASSSGSSTSSSGSSSASSSGSSTSSSGSSTSSSGSSSASSSGSSTSSSGSSSSGSSSSSSGSSSGGAAAAGTDVSTYKNDLSRDGANLTESLLTLANVNMSSFGLLHTLTVQGQVYAQPLYLSQLTIGGVAHNVVFIATEHDMVYAFDADSGAALWQASLLAAGETTSDPRNCTQITPEIGVTATPVIDRAAGALFLAAMSKDAAGAYHQRIHALSITTGAELTGSPVSVQPTYPMANSGTATFDPGQYKERAALLLLNGVVYTSWASHCDNQPYSGWLVGYNETTLAQASVLNIAANGAGEGPSIWMANGGLSVDANGNIYVLAANGAFETMLNTAGFPNAGDYGSSMLKIATTGGTLQVADYFTFYNEAAAELADQDFGSSDAMLLPDMTDAGGTLRHLAVGAGKDGNIYVINRDQMGKFNATSNNIWQQLNGVFPHGIFSTPAYFNGTIYYGGLSDNLKAFPVSAAMVSATATSQSVETFAYPGTGPSVSANGSSNGIVWTIERGTPEVLHAYDASNLATELYNSSQAANGRDQLGGGITFATPTIADGKVFVGTTNSVGVFGLL